MSYVSHADIGGRDGYGAVRPEPEGELFHARWEPRVLALTLAMGPSGAWNIDASRSARETLPDYARLSYYEIWFEALCRLLEQRGLIRPAELAAGRPMGDTPPLARVLRADEVPAALARGTPTERSTANPARFSLGDAVRTYAGEVPHHTRLPHYARGKRGRVERVHGPHVFADANASGRGEMPQWLYTVAFDGRELWGADATAGLRVSIDAWEPYLDQA
jgi:nitrile hydratase beta subunit